MHSSGFVNLYRLMNEAVFGRTNAEFAAQLHSACIFGYDGAITSPVRKITDS